MSLIVCFSFSQRHQYIENTQIDFHASDIHNFVNRYWAHVPVENLANQGHPQVKWKKSNVTRLSITHTADTEFSETNFFCLHFSEHAQWGLPVMSDILVKIFVDIS